MSGRIGCRPLCTGFWMYGNAILILGLCLAAPMVCADDAVPLLIPPSPFAEALTLPEASSIVAIPETTDEGMSREELAPGPMITAGGPCPCPHCRSGSSPGVGSGACVRGTDHLGRLYSHWIGDGHLIEGAATATVYAANGVFNAVAQIDHIFHPGAGNPWVRPCGEAPCPLCCKLQCKFVNWRHGSMYLQGCMPEGYALGRFIDLVPTADFHDAPLSLEAGVASVSSTTRGKSGPRPITQVSLDITPPAGILPGEHQTNQLAHSEVPQVQLPGASRNWCGTTFYWNASLLNHQPLYFEDVNLERHGYSHGPIMQPVVSGAKFFATLPALPYLMTAQPPHTTRYTLGESRPGSPAPYVCEMPPLDLDAAAVQGAVVTGLIFLIP